MELLSKMTIVAAGHAQTAREASYKSGCCNHSLSIRSARKHPFLPLIIAARATRLRMILLIATSIAIITHSAAIINSLNSMKNQPTMHMQAISIMES